MFLPKDNSQERDNHHAVEEKGEEDDDDEQIEERAMARTEAVSSLTAFDTRAAEELLQPKSHQRAIVSACIEFSEFQNFFYKFTNSDICTNFKFESIYN